MRHPQAWKKYLRQFNVEGKIAVVPNGVDLKNFYEATPLSRAEFGYKEDDILLVYAGRIAPEKNLPFLLKSFAGVAQAIPNVHLLLLGSGIQQFEEEIRNLVGELDLTQRVRLTGRIAYDKLPAYLAMCNIFVTASDYRSASAFGDRSHGRRTSRHGHSLRWRKRHSRGWDHRISCDA